MEFALNPVEESPRRARGLVIVVLLHALVGYALVSGLARKAVNLIKKPLEATVVQEVQLPPPPPPPPKQIKQEQPPASEPTPYVPKPDVPVPQTATEAVVSAVTNTPPPEPAHITPPPAAPALPPKVELRLACPQQIAPEMPQRALDDGIGGTVKAQALIRNGKVIEVQILSGPRIFHNAVRQAVMQYRCVSGADDVVATQDFVFQVE
ncbi:hypothetical protein GCM10025771_40080 [Niveibacterium umoris]|uniref:Protein TonB n=1 Tax=Niveibacterium umoris TaxID=1193620 RepID=A0A840BCN3_9RHOO|nr:energy transducer TonB [Niveibacterium umoris]MBB4010790.1 protein TonB [Niveibacterium umoris]